MWELDHKEGRAPKNWCFPTVVLEKTFESLLDSKEIKPVNLKGNQHWILIGRTDAEANTLATWCEEMTHCKRPWCWERLKAGGEGDDRGWDGWVASLIQWTLTWANSGRWWGTGNPGVLQSMGSQEVRNDLTTEHQQRQRILKSRSHIFRENIINVWTQNTWLSQWNLQIGRMLQGKV